jgi:hypothetical protein
MGKADIMFYIFVRTSVKSALHIKAISNKTYSELKISLFYHKLCMDTDNCEVSGFRYGVFEVSALLGVYAALVGSLLTFRGSISVPFPRFKKSKNNADGQ